MLLADRTRVVPLDETVTLAFAPRLSIAVWRKDVTLTHLMALGRELRMFLPSCRGQGYAMVTVIEPGISLRLPDDVRASSETMQREFQQHIRCQAYLVTHEGFAAAAARTIASGFALVTRAPYPLKVLATPLETAMWVSTFCDLPTSEVERVLGEARAIRPRRV